MKKIIFILFLVCGMTALDAYDFPVKISSIKLTGNKALTRKEIIAGLPVQNQGLTDRIKSMIPLISKPEQELYYQEDILYAINMIVNRYQKSGFLKVKVDYRLIPKKQHYQLHFNIQENDRVIIRKIDIKYKENNEIEEQLNFNTKKWVYTDYSDDNFIGLNKQLENKLLESGYLRQKINHLFELNSDSTEVKIVFDIDEGKKHFIEDIEIKGLINLKPKTVLRQLPLEDSTLYHPDQINWYKQQLVLLNHFNSIGITAEPVEKNENKADISIIVSEKKKHQFKSGIGYGIEDLLRAFIEYNQTNFLGNARLLQINLKRTALEPWNLNIKTREPLPFRHSFYGSFNPFWLKQNEDIFELERMGFTLGISQQLNTYNSYQVHYLFEQNHLLKADVYQTDDLLSVYNKSSAFFYWLSNFVSTQNGLNSSFNINYSGLGFGSKYHYLRGISDTRYYLPLTNSNSLAFRIKYGHLISYDNDKIVPVEERFYAGGANSIRGWRRNDISPLNNNNEKTGGSRLLELSAEHRFIILKNFEFALFIDSGNVWNNHPDFNYLLTSVGTGLRYYSLFGPIRIDFARPIDLNKWQFYIQIGQSF